MSDSVWPHRRQPTRLPRPWDSPSKNTGVGCHFFFQCLKVKSESEVAQLCPTLSNPMDRSLRGSSVHGIFQARVLEWDKHCEVITKIKSISISIILQLPFFFVVRTFKIYSFSKFQVYYIVLLILEKEMATHFSILAWKVQRTEEPCRLQSISHHDT